MKEIQAIINISVEFEPRKDENEQQFADRVYLGFIENDIEYDIVNIEVVPIQ